MFGGMLMLMWVTFAVGGHELLHRVWKPAFSEENKSVALTLLALIATLNSLLLAFSAVSVWEAYRSANDAVSGEAVTLAELSRDLAVYQSTASLAARDQVRLYAKDVVDREWTLMQTDQRDLLKRTQFDNIFHALAALEPATPRETIMLTEIWARANGLIKYRRDRLDASESRVPDTLWAVVVLGSLLSLSPLLVLPRSEFNRVAIGVLSLSTGLVFFFVVTMDRPFIGRDSITPEPFQATLNSMADWDLERAGGPLAGPLH
ncbi:MAG: hypothetical protein ABW220_07750 [Burkholderiaceae bacterium]